MKSVVLSSERLISDFAIGVVLKGDFLGCKLISVYQKLTSYSGI